MGKMKSLLLIGDGASEGIATDLEALMVTRSNILIGHLRDERDLATCDLQFVALVIAGSISPELAEAVLASAVPFGYVVPRTALEAVRADNPMLLPWAAALLSAANVVLVPATRDAINLKESSGVSLSCQILAQDEFGRADLDCATSSSVVSAMVEHVLQRLGSTERMNEISGRELYSIMMAANAAYSHEAIDVNLAFPAFRARPWEPFGVDSDARACLPTPQFPRWRGHVVSSLPLTKNGKALWGKLVIQAELARQFCIEWNLGTLVTASCGADLAKNAELKGKLERAGIPAKLLGRLTQTNTRGAEPFEGLNDEQDRSCLSSYVGELLRFNEERLS